MESRYLQWRVRTRYIDTLHPPGGQVQVVHDVVEAIEHEDDGGGEGGDVPAVDGDPLLHPPPVPLQLGRVLHYDRVQLLQLLLLTGSATGARTRGQHAPVQCEVNYHLYSHSTYLLIQQSVGWFGNYADD